MSLQINDVQALQQTQKDQNPSQNSDKRVPQNLFLYWMSNLLTICLSSLNFDYFLSTDLILLMCLSIIQIIWCTLFFLASSCYYSLNKWDLCQLYFMLDTMLMAWVLSAIGLYGMVFSVKSQDDPYIWPIIQVILWSVNSFMMIGNSRITYARCGWKKYQIIVTKIAYLFAVVAYLVVTLIYLYNSQSHTETTKQMILLYVFGYLTLFLELNSKLTDLDGTSELKYYYQIPSNLQIQPLNNSSLISQNNINTQNNIK